MMPLFKQNASSKQIRPLANITQKMTLAYGAVVLILTFSLLVVGSLYHAVIDISLLMVFLALISLIVVFFMSLYFGQTIQKAIDGLITDINERQQTEEALKQAKQAAEEANLAKSQFLLSSCHELRTPFCAIIGYSEMLCMDAEEKGLDNFAKEKGLADFVGDLNRIHSAGKHLLGLINDYTDLCKLESGEMNICNETFELSHVLDEVIEITQPLVERKSNTLQVEMDETLGEMYTDMHKVRHILLHLLSYRVRMTAQGIIVFKVTRTQEKDIDWVTFQIRDTGIGLSQEEIGKIFLPFIFSINPYERMELGLMIAREFTEMIGGNMTIESELGQGTMFTVRLPAQV